MNLKFQVNLILPLSLSIPFYTPLVFVHCSEFIFFFRNVPWSNKCRAAMTLVHCHSLYTYSVTLLSCSLHVLFFSCTFHLFYILLISYIIHVCVVTHIQLLCPFLSLYHFAFLSYENSHLRHYYLMFIHLLFAYSLCICVCVMYVWGSSVHVVVGATSWESFSNAVCLIILTWDVSLNLDLGYMSLSHIFSGIINIPTHASTTAFT